MNKKIGLIGVIITLISVIISSILLLQKPTSNIPRRTVSQTVPDLPKYNPRDLSKFSQHTVQLERELSSQSVEFNSGAMKVFGYKEDAFKESLNLPEKEAYHIAMIFISGKQSSVLIDDKLYRRGDVLPNGEKIKKINFSGVTVEKDGKTNLLIVDDVTTAPINGKNVKQSNSLDNSFETVISSQRQIDAIKDSLKMLQNRNNSQL